MFKKILLFLVSMIPVFSGQGKLAKVNGIKIWYEAFGSKENPAVLLIMGGCCQGVLWDESFCQRLSDAGTYVIRYDHRDTGLSSCFDFEKEPYDLVDMAKDAIGVLDDAGIQKAHLFGVSMGGFIAEIMAGKFPERVNSILVMGASSEIKPMNRSFIGLPPDEDVVMSPPALHYVEWMREFLKLSPTSMDEKLEQRLEGWNRLNGQKIPLNETTNRKIHKEFLSRLHYPRGIVNHITMQRNKASEDMVRSAPLSIDVPTVILQGSEDPIFPIDHGIELSQKIKNSEYYLVEGMGHIPNDHFYDLYIEILKRQAY